MNNRQHTGSEWLSKSHDCHVTGQKHDLSMQIWFRVYLPLLSKMRMKSRSFSLFNILKNSTSGEVYKMT